MMDVLVIVVILVLMGLLMYGQWKVERTEQQTDDRYKFFDKTGRKRTP